MLLNNNTDLSTAEYIRHVPPPAALQAPPLAWMFPHVPVVVNESNRQPAAAQTLTQFMSENCCRDDGWNILVKWSGGETKKKFLRCIFFHVIGSVNHTNRADVKTIFLLLTLFPWQQGMQICQLYLHWLCQRTGGKQISGSLTKSVWEETSLLKLDSLICLYI